MYYKLYIFEQMDECIFTWKMGGKERIEFRIGIRLFTYLFDYLH